MACIVTNFTPYKCRALEKQLINIIRHSHIWSSVYFTRFIDDCRKDYKLFNFRYAKTHEAYNAWTHFVRKISRVNHIKYLNTMTQIYTYRYKDYSKTVLTRWYPTGKMKELMTEKDYIIDDNRIRKIRKITWDSLNVSNAVEIKIMNGDWENAIYKTISSVKY